MFKLIIIFGIIILVLIIIIRYLWLKNSVLKDEVSRILNRKQSLSVKYGKMTEQFLPFLEQYPYDEQNFRFLGSPIDGVQFEDDKIILIEFKAADSKLTPKQNRIKNQVLENQVYFKEFNLSPRADQPLAEK